MVGKTISFIVRADIASVHDRGGESIAHAAGIGSGIAVAHPLVILRGRERQRMNAVADDEEARLLAFEIVLDDALGFAEFVREDVAEWRHLASLAVHSDGDAFSRREPVGLDDDRRAFPRRDIQARALHRWKRP